MSETKEFMQSIARGLDTILNGDEAQSPTRMGFVLLLFPFDQVEGSRTNYVSNCDRRDIIAALKEVTARFEGSPHQTGRA
jgi:hypothetical protein